MGLRLGALAIALAGWLGHGVAAATAPQSGEYEVKAAFLYNFAKFVEWPAQAFASPTAPFWFCVLGPDPFGAVLDATVEGERIDGRPLRVRRLQGWDDAEQCQLLFVSSSVQEDFVQLLSAHDFRRTLTVGEVPQFLQAGGHISFYLERTRVRFAVNLDSVGRTDLQISSKLMRVARVARTGATQ